MTPGSRYFSVYFYDNFPATWYTDGRDISSVRYKLPKSDRNAAYWAGIADNSSGGKAFSGVCDSLCVCVCVCPLDITKTAETKIANLPQG